MRKTIVIAVISLIIAGCSKDEFTTEPKLKFESVDTRDLHIDQIIRFKLSFTDKEGDLMDTVFIEKTGARCALSNMKLKYPFPEVSGSTIKDGEMRISFANGINVPGYQSLSIAPRCDENDTCNFKFVLRDKAGHTSDTVESGTIVIYKD